MQHFSQDDKLDWACSEGGTNVKKAHRDFLSLHVRRQAEYDMRAVLL